MRTIKIALFIICGLISQNIFAQTTAKNIIKVSYTTTSVSDFLVGMLKTQIQDPAEFENVLAMMGEYKIHSSLLQDVRTNESIFVLDSISDVPGMSISGYPKYVHRSTEGEYMGQETFMDKNFNFTGTDGEITWNITDMNKEVNGYNCIKAVMVGNEEVYVWFAPEIAVNGGPYVYSGLPGLVMETNGTFSSSVATAINYAEMEEFSSRVHSVQNSNDKKEEISLEEVFAKKANFKRLVAGN